KNGYIQAIVKPVEHDKRIVSRRITIFINSSTYEVQNYFDNNNLKLDSFSDYKQVGEIRITKETAYTKLLDVIKLEPYYVYDAELGHYILCGKLDCQYAVNGYNGERVLLSEL